MMSYRVEIYAEHLAELARAGSSTPRVYIRVHPDRIEGLGVDKDGFYEVPIHYTSNPVIVTWTEGAECNKTDSGGFTPRTEPTEISKARF